MEPTKRNRARPAAPGAGSGGARWRGRVALAVGLPLSFCLAMPAAAAPTGAQRDSPASYTQQKLLWGECPFAPAKDALSSECAEVTVPRDWSAPGAGEDLRVSVSRVRTSAEDKELLLVNPGGPGGRGTPLAGEVAGLEPALTEQYDIIGMNPRGTGEEGAGEDLVCKVPSEEMPQQRVLDARDRSERSIAEHQRYPRALAEACEKEPLTSYVTTWQTAHDMDLIRALLGERKLSYLGYSYGTWLGAKYAALFPARAGKMVLDSSVNWQGRLQADFEDFPRIDQRQLEDVYLPWAARNYPADVGSTAAQAHAMWERVRAYYVSHGSSGDSYDSLFVGMGSEFQWLLATLVFDVGARALQEPGEDSPPAISAALRVQMDARAQAVFGVPAAEVTVDRVVGVLNEEDADVTERAGTRHAVACGDQHTRSADWYRKLSDRQGPRLPLFGWAYGLTEACGHWTGSPRHHLPVVPWPVTRKVMVVQGEFDPQTGYEQALAAVHRAPGAAMVSVDDAAFHGQYALGGNACVDDVVNGFLLEGERPDRTTCAGTPLPGEPAVHPVPGPVTAQHALRKDGREDTSSVRLRESARESVSAVNRFAP